MREPDIFPRFAALHRAVAKMGYSSRPAPAAANTPAQMPAPAPTLRSRPSTQQAPPVEWIRAEEMHQALARHSLRRAELRAERELADGRARMTQTVSQLRQAQLNDDSRRNTGRWTNSGQRIVPTLV